jgi:hypothetical protein
MLLPAPSGRASALCALADNACDAYRAVGPQLAEHPGGQVNYGFCPAVAIHFAPTVPLPLLEMYTRGITFHLSRADSRRLLPVVLELFVEGRFDPLAVPTTIVPWDRADEAWLEPATKLVLERA